MGVATIQITQGALVGNNGKSLLGLVGSGGAVTLTDAGGAGATSYLWEMLTFPATLAVAPPIASATTQVASATVDGSGATVWPDGLYVVRLTRVEGAVTTVDTKFFGVADADGLHLPSAGVGYAMCDLVTGGFVEASKRFGYQGSAMAGTNTLLDAWLRLRKSREGKAKISGSDGYFALLGDKLVAGTNVTLTTNSGGAPFGDTITIAASGGGGGSSETPISVDPSITQNDYNPTGWETSTTVRLGSGLAGNSTISGFSGSGSSLAVKKLLFNTGAKTITLLHQSASSTAANRIIIAGGQDLLLEPDDSASIYYDSTTSRWRVY